MNDAAAGEVPRGERAVDRPLLTEPGRTAPRLQLLGLPLVRLLVAWLVGSAVSVVAGWLAFVLLVVVTLGLTWTRSVLGEVLTAVVLAVLVVGAAVVGAVSAAFLWAAHPALVRSTRPWQWAVIGLPPALVVVVLGLLLWRPFDRLEPGRSLVVLVCLILAGVAGPVAARWRGRRSAARAAHVRASGGPRLPADGSLDSTG